MAWGKLTPNLAPLSPPPRRGRVVLWTRVDSVGNHPTNPAGGGLARRGLMWTRHVQAGRVIHEAILVPYTYSWDCHSSRPPGRRGLIRIYVMQHPHNRLEAKRGPLRSDCWLARDICFTVDGIPVSSGASRGGGLGAEVVVH